MLPARQPSWLPRETRRVAGAAEIPSQNSMPSIMLESAPTSTTALSAWQISACDTQTLLLWLGLSAA